MNKARPMASNRMPEQRSCDDKASVSHRSHAPRKEDNMTTAPDSKPQDEDPIGEARMHDERPVMVGDFGQDSVFATESHPEGLRYGDKTPRAPGVEPHLVSDDTPHHEPGAISIG